MLMESRDDSEKEVGLELLMKVDVLFCSHVLWADGV